MRITICVLIVMSVLTACAASPSKTKDRSPLSASLEENSIGSAGIDYGSLYCANVFKIKLRTDIKTELDLMCKDGRPTALFQEYRRKALQQGAQKIDINFLMLRHTEVSDRSEYTLIWSFHSPLRPYEVKARPLYQYIAKGYQDNELRFQISPNRLNDAPLDSGLHLWTTEMSYALEVKALPTLAIINDRKTQYNLYQVLSGNEEMGLGVEHLIESPDNTYRISNLVNFSFNDGNGYNDGKGGTVVINLLRFDFVNQGFPDTAVKTMSTIAQSMADNMQNGLKN